jgi:hypothetical protein
MGILPMPLHGEDARGTLGGKIIAVVGGFLVAHPLDLRLGALIVFCGVVEAAIAAGMEVEITLLQLVSISVLQYFSTSVSHNSELIPLTN